MEHAQFSFIPLLIVVGIAFVVPILLSRLRGIFIPIIIGEILAGVAVGKSGLNLVQENTVLEILSTLGFIYFPDHRRREAGRHCNPAANLWGKRAKKFTTTLYLIIRERPHRKRPLDLRQAPDL